MTIKLKLYSDISWSTADNMRYSLSELDSLTIKPVPFIEEKFGLKEGTEVSVTYTNSKEIRSLNKQYRSVDKPTNVLSFPCDYIHGMLGDIVLAVDVIEEEAKEQGKIFEDHFIHLVVHSFLHLLGYDHIKDAEAEEMEALEVEILKALRIRNPYLEIE